MLSVSSINLSVDNLEGESFAYPNSDDDFSIAHLDVLCMCVPACLHASMHICVCKDVICQLI